ncbi:hypothetical protein RHS04_01080 [Rhizoctonia solani]|uniref:Uncharacterized protein n=1 Tax=Rhizoctonia solani TaxID=456999 RepID=A0A8H7LNF6_9AGAM|nr:hypothetical protein RHS04_01080 [Rhizoctonia solani]
MSRVLCDRALPPPPPNPFSADPKRYPTSFNHRRAIIHAQMRSGPPSIKPMDTHYAPRRPHLAGLTDPNQEHDITLAMNPYPY